MAPEVEAGAITEAELDALSGDRMARKAYVKLADDRRHAGHVREASGDLAETTAKAHGTGTDRVTYARSEVLRLCSK